MSTVFNCYYKVAEFLPRELKCNSMFLLSYHPIHQDHYLLISVTYLETHLHRYRLNKLPSPRLLAYLLSIPCSLMRATYSSQFTPLTIQKLPALDVNQNKHFRRLTGNMCSFATTLLTCRRIGWFLGLLRLSTERKNHRGTKINGSEDATDIGPIFLPRHGAAVCIATLL